MAAEAGSPSSGTVRADRSKRELLVKALYYDILKGILSPNNPDRRTPIHNNEKPKKN